MLIGVYRIYFIATGKSYIGRSLNINKRIRQHFAGYHTETSYLDAAIQKHGNDAFSWEILELCSEDVLDDRECHWISTFNCIRPNGYNLKTGGISGKHTKMSRQKLSKSLTGRKLSKEHRDKIAKYQTGRKKPFESRRKLSESRKGIKFSKEHRQKLSEAAKNRKTNPRGMLGKQHTDETRKKMSEEQRKRWANR